MNTFFDCEGIAELYELRTREYRDDFALLATLASGGDAVLDVACGAGRATTFLAGITKPVVGVDSSVRMLRLAQARTQRLKHPPSLIQADATHFRLRAQFTLVTMLCNSFVDLVLPEAQRQCLDTLRDHLTPHGHLLIDITSPRTYGRIDGQSIELPCPPVGNSTRVECRLRSTMRSNERRLEEISYRFYEGDTLARELRAEHERALIGHAQFLQISRQAGLVPVNVFGSYRCEPYDENVSPWQIYVLRRATHGQERLPPNTRRSP